MINSTLLGYDTDTGVSSPISGKRNRNLSFELQKKECKKLKSLQKLLELMNQSSQY